MLSVPLQIFCNSSKRAKRHIKQCSNEFARGSFLKNYGQSFNIDLIKVCIQQIESFFHLAHVPPLRVCLRSKCD